MSKNFPGVFLEERYGTIRPIDGVPTSVTVVVNVLVGFAPLKPAEFVLIKLQQMAGRKHCGKS